MGIGSLVGCQMNQHDSARMAEVLASFNRGLRKLAADGRLQALRQQYLLNADAAR